MKSNGAKMIIRSLSFKNIRGFSFKFRFQPTENVLIGPNGCGKSTVLDLLAALTGSDLATMAFGEKFENASRITISVEEDFQTYSLSMKGFDYAKVHEFKDNFKARTSYVLRDDLNDDRFVTEKDDHEVLWKNIDQFLNRHDLKLTYRFFEGEGASCFISETGAQRYLLDVGMRLAPAHIPMLIDGPERHLHVMIKRAVNKFYGKPSQQYFMATHSPEIVSRYNSDFEEMNSIFDLTSKGYMF